MSLAPATDSLPAGFEPFTPPPAQNAPAATPESVQTLPAGFEPFAPNANLKITPQPPSFLDRIMSGKRVYDSLESVWKETKRGFGDQPLSTRTSDEGLVGVLKTPVELYDLLTRTINAGIHGTADIAAQAARDFGYSQGMSERAREDVMNFGTWLMTEGGMRATMADAAKHAPLVDAGDGKLARIVPGPNGTATTEIVGEFPPKPADFDTAAAAVAQQTAKPDIASVRQKLLDAWENESKHPAEIVQDAKNDAFVAHDLSSAAAHPTDLPPLIPPAAQPISIPGKILRDLGGIKDQAFNVGRWIEKELTPIASSPDYAVRYATEYLSSLRRVQWDWNRYDRMLTEKFTPEAREAMWRAMDEESVMAQSGERSEHMGLTTLAPEERAAVSELTQHAIATRLQMLDREMVTTEGLPHYVPRLFKNKGGGEAMSIGPEARIRERTGTMSERKYLTADESEAAAKARFGEQTSLIRDIRTLPLALAKQQRAIAAHDFIEAVRKFGRDIGDNQIVEGAKPTEGKWFTIPDSDLADWYFRSNGDTTFATKQPMHIKAEWEGAVRAIQDNKFNNFDKFIAEIKNRPMTLIMNSPFIHASVVYSKALPSNPGNMLTFRFMRQGNQLLNDQKFMRDMLDGGMVLWGRRPTLYQDVAGIMEGPQLEPGRSLTSRVLAYIPGLFDEAAGTKVKMTVDKIGEIVHDKILAENVQKLQASLAYDFRETMRAKHPDIPDDVLNVLAAHEANRFGGSLPPEAMSAFSRGFANATLFSRQFTLGNLGILKDAIKGPPEYVMGRIRDMLGPEGAEHAATIKSDARRHAFAVVMLDLAMYYGVNSLLQSAVHIASGTPMSDEVAGYWWRLKQAANRVEEHPMSLGSYLSFLPSMSPTFYHEPGKEGKILLGFRDDGTAIYGRSVIGRMGEDYTGLLVNPAVYGLTKMAPLTRAFWEVLGNKDGFDRPIYDPKALKGGDLWQAWNVAKHFIEAELPMQQVKGAANLIEGTGDYKDAISTFGPYMVPPFTMTASQGYPGGPIAGAVAGHKRDQRIAQDLAMSQVKDMVVKKNDVVGARQLMDSLGVNSGLQRFLIRNWQNPGLSKTSPRALAEFYQHASPIEKEILDYMQNGGVR